MRFCMLVLYFIWQHSHAEKLVDSYLMDNENYITDLIVRCVDRHVEEKSNSIDPHTQLPVSRLDKVIMGSPFTYPHVVVSFSSSLDENVLERIGTTMGCAFDRFTGDLLDISSTHFLMPESNISYSIPTPKVAKRYEKYDGEDLTVEDLYFGIRLDYDAVLEMLKKANQSADSETATN